MAGERTHYRCEECGYAWRGSAEVPLSRCPQCGRSDKLVVVDDAAEQRQQRSVEQDTGAGMGGRFSMSTELALVAAIVVIVLLLVGAVVTFLFFLSGSV